MTTTISDGTYVGFYPSRRYFAIRQVELPDGDATVSLHNKLSEVVLGRHEDRFSVFFQMDGCVLFRLHRYEGGVNKNTVVNNGFDRLLARWGEYLKYMNVLYILLDIMTCEKLGVSYFSYSEISMRDAFPVQFEGGFEKGKSIAMESIASKFQSERFWSGNSDQIKHDERYFLRITLPEEVLNSAIERLYLLSNTDGGIDIVSGICKSVSEYKQGNFSVSLVLSWFVVERAIFREWGDSIRKRKETNDINKDRMENLIGRDFTASIVSNIMNILGEIDNDLFKSIDRVRGLRNKIVHGDTRRVTAKNAIEAIDIASLFVNRQFGFSIKPNLSISATGLW